MTSALDRLREYGYEIPPFAPPAASYVPVTRSGNLMFVSGQVSRNENGIVTGKLGETMNVVQGGNAAELCALQILGQIFHAGVELEAVKRVLKLTVLVASRPDFTEHHLVANGASNLIIGVLGDRGQHARAAFGVAALPLGAAVEVEAIIEV